MKVTEARRRARLALRAGYYRPRPIHPEGYVFCPENRCKVEAAVLPWESEATLIKALVEALTQHLAADCEDES